MSLLGIDVGTTGCKAAAYAVDGHCIALAYREHATLHPRPGWAELDSRAVWQNVVEVIRDVAGRTQHDPITALSTSSLGESGVWVTAAREILGNSILFADRRGDTYAQSLRARFPGPTFYRINPNIPGPNYSLPKLMWIREHEPERIDRADYFLLWGDLVPFMLGCGPTASYSLANRTLLFDLTHEDWSDTLLEWAGIERGLLGLPVPGGTVLGTVAHAVAAQLGLPADVQVVTGGHDQCCNALGAGAIEAGRAVCGIGSFECITPVYSQLPPLEPMLQHGLNIEHHVLPDRYVSFIYNQAGTLIKWFRDTFATSEKNAGVADLYGRLDAEMPASPTRLLVLPYFEPTGPPGFVSDAAGAMVGLRTETSRGEILKAIMECATLYFADCLDSLRQLGIDTSEFVATGGGARSDAWLQIKADVFGVPFVRPRITEASVLGAALLAGIATGVYADAAEASACCLGRDRVFEPDPERHERYVTKLAQYRELWPALHSLLARL